MTTVFNQLHGVRWLILVLYSLFNLFIKLVTALTETNSLFQMQTCPLQCSSGPVRAEWRRKHEFRGLLHSIIMFLPPLQWVSMAINRFQACSFQFVCESVFQSVPCFSHVQQCYNSCSLMVKQHDTHWWPDTTKCLCRSFWKSLSLIATLKYMGNQNTLKPMETD